MKTPEQMAKQFVDLCNDDDRVIAYAAFLAGYQAAKDQLQPQPFHAGADVYIIDANNPLPKPMPLSIAEQDQLADAGKVVCSTTMEEIKAVDTDEITPITNLPTPAKWISVKELLPERSQKVLALGEDQTVLLLKLRETYDKDLFGNWEYVSGFDQDVNGYLVIDVSHWMPLPEPPKGED